MLDINYMLRLYFCITQVLVKWHVWKILLKILQH